VQVSDTYLQSIVLYGFYIKFKCYFKKDTKVVLELARNKHAPPTYRELDVTYSLPYNSNA